LKPRPYPVYKDSGVPWLGEVPEHRDVRRLKYLLLRERDVRSADGTEQLLRVSQYTGVTERMTVDGANEPDTRAESLVGYKRVRPDEFVVNIMLAWNGSMGVSHHSGIVSPAYCVYRFGASAHPWYFHYLLRSTASKARIKAVSTGVVESRLCLYTDAIVVESTRGRFSLPNFKGLRVILPPLDEQVRICDEIKKTTCPVLIAASRAMREIDLLREYRTRLIADVVPGKLDVRGVELPEVEEVEAQENWDEDADVEAEEIADVEEAVDADK
jgi:type I restriction enzyme S subunit